MLPDFIPAVLRAELGSKITPEINQRSFFISGITQAEILQKVKDDITKVIGGKMTESQAQSQLKQAGDLLSGTVLQKDSRLKLVLSTNVDLARGYGQWKQGQSKFVLKEFPAQELYRAERRKEPRDWPKIWAAAGGKFYPGASDYAQGRMIALKNDPIWVHISAFGLPYAPFDFNSGMALKDVDVTESKKLGVSPAPARESDPATVTTSSRTIPLFARTPSLVATGTSPQDIASQEAFIQQQQEAEQQPQSIPFNHNLQAHPEVEDDALLSVLQALFAEFATLGVDQVFHENERAEDASRN